MQGDYTSTRSARLLTAAFVERINGTTMNSANPCHLHRGHHLPLELAQFIAYVTLTLTGITVAIVSLRYSFRQNFGWEPLLLITGHGLRGGGSLTLDDAYVATLSFEFWNSRTYPLAVRSISVEFSDFKFLPDLKRDEFKTDWYLEHRGRGHLHAQSVVPPKGHTPYEFIAPFPKRTLDDLSVEVSVTVSFFDPRRNKTEQIHSTYIYQMGGNE